MPVRPVLSFVLVLLGTTAACNFNPAGCIDTKTTAEPADGAGGAEVFLVAKVRAEGKPLVGVNVEYTLIEPGGGSDVGNDHTDDNGVARYPLTYMVKSGQLGEMEASNAIGFIATVDSFRRGETYYCRSEATADVRWSS